MKKKHGILNMNQRITINTKRYEENMPISQLRQINQEDVTQRFLLRNTSTKTITTKTYQQLKSSQSYKNLKFTLQQLQDKVRSAHSQIVIMQTQKPSLYQIQSNSREQNYKLKLNKSEILSSHNQLSSSISAPNLLNTSSLINTASKQYYISQLTRAVNEKNSLAIEHVNTSIQILKFCRNQQMPNGFQLQSRQINLQKHKKYHNKKTLLLDLDETLIHTLDNNLAKTDANLSFKTSSKSSLKISLNIRPYALTFLKKMSKKFQIIIFTASHSNYANQILDYLDPNNQYIAHRLYRQHCTALQNGIHVKDLRLINRPLSQMILVDNAAYSYAFQLQNGIPILPYYDGKDTQLYALENYLQQIDKFSDIRQCNKQMFKLHHYIKFDNAKQLIQQLYMPNSR